MKFRLLIITLLLATTAFAQGTRGRMYFNKELNKWTYTANTDSADVRWSSPMCFGDFAPWQQAAASGTATIQLDSNYAGGSLYSRSMCYLVSNTTVNWYGIVRLPNRYRFTDSIKYWFSNRSLVNDTCVLFISRRTAGSVCSLFIYNYGTSLTDTLMRMGFPTGATSGDRPDTVAITFEQAVKDSNAMFPLKFSNGQFMPCVFFNLKVVTSGTYHVYGFRVLTRWQR